MKLLNERGQGLTEYIILLMLVSIISIGAVQGLGKAVSKKINDAKEHINKEVSPTPSKDGDGGDGGKPHGTFPF